jgi:chlorophyll synthase
MGRSATLTGIEDRPRPLAVLTLLKPYTWFPPMWAFFCGAVSSGVAMASDWWAVCAGVLLAGPFVCGTSQAINDWYDRDVDAINEPSRPIPSGRVPGRWGLWIGIVGTLASLALALTLGPWVVLAAAAGLLLAWIYSAPPLRLKRNGWWGNSAVALSYEGLPWFTAAAAMTAALPDAKTLLVALLYSAGCHGIMTLNDFKSVRGDEWTGVRSIPVQLGMPRAAKLACIVMLVPQLVLIALLWLWGAAVFAATLALLATAQVLMMRKLLRAPDRFDRWYNRTGVPVYVLGMMVSAFALRSLQGAVGQ